MILVTGGTGMLGAHLLLHLVKNGEKIRAIKRDSSNLDNVKKIFSFYQPNSDELFSKIEWVDADILDAESISDALQGIEKVFHAAAIVSFNLKDKYQMIDNNVKGTTNIVNQSLLAGIKKLCHISSIAALGHAETGALTDEETYRNPKDHYSGYSISKYYSELEVWRGITEGLNAVIVNPSIILGPGNWQLGSPSIFTNIAKGLKFYTKGITGYVDVWDVVNATVKLMESEIGAQRFVISGKNLSFQEIFSLVADALKVKKPGIYANSLMLGIAWRLEAIKSLITKHQPLITKDTANSAKNSSLYSSKKIIDTLNFKFTPIEESINQIAKIYLQDMDGHNL